MKAWRQGLAGILVLAAGGLAQSAPDALHGEQIYLRCQACHALAYDRVGPRHCGLFGRRAGSVSGFAYSQAMKDSRIVWDDQTLARFLRQPVQVVPGTTMTYDGIADPKDLADLLAYLKRANETPECRQAVAAPVPVPAQPRR